MIAFRFIFFTRFLLDFFLLQLLFLDALLPGVKRSELPQHLTQRRFHKSSLSFSPLPIPRLLPLQPPPTKKTADSRNLLDCTPLTLPPQTRLFVIAMEAKPSQSSCRYRDFRPAPPVSATGGALDFSCAFDNAGELLPPLLCVMYRLGTDVLTSSSISLQSAAIAGALARVLVGIDVDVGEAALALLMVLQQHCNSNEAFCAALLETQTSEFVTSKPPFSSSSIISSISGASSNTICSVSNGNTVIHCILTACISSKDLHAAAAMLCIASLALNHTPAALALAAAPQTLSTIQMVCGRLTHYASSGPSTSATLAAACLMLSALLHSPALSPLIFKLGSFASPFTSEPPLSTALHVLAHIVTTESLENCSVGSAVKISRQISRVRVTATTALAYVALSLPALWDSFISSSISSLPPPLASLASSSAVVPNFVFAHALMQLLPSVPCQVFQIVVYGTRI